MAASIIQDLSLLTLHTITFEDYGPINRFAGKITQRAELCGIIKYHALAIWKVPVLMLAPTSLKSFATGKGKASKDDMMRAAHKYGYYPETHDEADAFHAARLGYYIHRGTKTGVSYHRVNP
jgi:hypothetical protein